MVHFHVATGLSGYGPDGSDGFATGETWRDVSDLIRGELSDAANMLHEDASTASERRDFERYHDCRELADELDLLSETLSNERRSAPLYAGNVALWKEMVRATVERQFPLNLDPDGRIRLYAWQCETPDDSCDHNIDALRAE